MVAAHRAAYYNDSLCPAKPVRQSRHPYIDAVPAGRKATRGVSTPGPTPPSPRDERYSELAELWGRR
jgi:hypothetical protein